MLPRVSGRTEGEEGITEEHKRACKVDGYDHYLDLKENIEFNYENIILPLVKLGDLVIPNILCGYLPTCFH